MSEIGSGVSNVDWNLKPNKPQSLNLSLPTPEIKLFSRESLEEEKAQISREKLTQPKEQNDTRTGICSAGFNPSSLKFGDPSQPQREISAGEAGKIVSTACKSELNDVKNAVQEKAYDTFGKTGATVIGGAAAIAVTGKIGGSTDIAGAKLSGQVNFRDKTANVGVSTKLGDVDFSANVQSRNGASPSGNLKASTQIMGLDVSANYSSKNEGNSKSSAGFFIGKSIQF
jgi:hypothetical protein